jgi:hypothetical protein
MVVATWNPQVTFTPDPANNGAPTPGLVGRVYLFGEDICYPMLSDGSLVVDLYKDTPGAASNASALLEEWRIDKDTLKRLERRDAIGWGYTLFLPWASYKPEITSVQLRLRYEQAKGSPLFASTSSLVFNKDGIPMSAVAATRTIKKDAIPLAAVAAKGTLKPGG